MTPLPNHVLQGQAEGHAEPPGFANRNGSGLGCPAARQGYQAAQMGPAVVLGPPCIVMTCSGGSDGWAVPLLTFDNTGAWRSCCCTWRQPQGVWDALATPAVAAQALTCASALSSLRPLPLTLLPLPPGCITCTCPAFLAAEQAGGPAGWSGRACLAAGRCACCAGCQVLPPP